MGEEDNMCVNIEKYWLCREIVINMLCEVYNICRNKLYKNSSL